MLLELWSRFLALGGVRLAALLAVLPGLCGGYWLGHQSRNEAQTSRAAWQSQREKNTAGERRLLGLRAELVEFGMDSIATQPFSPVDFQRQGVRLVSWLPTATGGEMVLETPWQQVAPTFTRLAECDMQVAAFSLAAESGVLRLNLQLVRGDEP